MKLSNTDLKRIADSLTMSNGELIVHRRRLNVSMDKVNLKYVEPGSDRIHLVKQLELNVDKINELVDAINKIKYVVE